MVGFGNNPANNVHHRGAHGSWANDIGGRPDAASHTLYGALAEGPLEPNDEFEDDRSDFLLMKLLQIIMLLLHLQSYQVQLL